jgi:hypothetical protein
VTHLRKMMIEELQRRNYSASTIRYYLRFVERFAQHFCRSPDKLGPEHLRTYHAYLVSQRKMFGELTDRGLRPVPCASLCCWDYGRADDDHSRARPDGPHRWSTGHDGLRAFPPLCDILAVRSHLASPAF